MDRRKALQVLGLQEGFTPDALKKAYRSAARKAHPDTGGSDKDFKLVVSAFEFLSGGGVSGNRVRVTFTHNSIFSVVRA